MLWIITANLELYFNDIHLKCLLLLHTKLVKLGITNK